MCIVCAKNNLFTDCQDHVHNFRSCLILGGHNLKSWRSETLNIIREYVGNRNFRVEDLSFVSDNFNYFLFSKIFRARVHPIYWPLLDSRQTWNLQFLWFKLGDAYNNQRLMIYFWNQLLQESRPLPFCLYNDIQEFDHLIDQQNFTGIISSLYAASPIQLKSYVFKDISEGKATVGRLMGRLRQIIYNYGSIEQTNYMDRDQTFSQQPGQSCWKWEKNY